MIVVEDFDSQTKSQFSIWESTKESWKGILERNPGKASEWKSEAIEKYQMCD